MLSKLFSIVSSFISNISIVLIFWSLLWYCLPYQAWDKVVRFLTLIHVTPGRDSILLTLSLTTLLVPCLLCSTSIAQRINLWMMGARRAKGAELERMQKAMSQICSVNGNSLAAYKLYVMDKEFCNAFAFGDNHICVTRPLLTALDDTELAGIMAHEAGHLHNGDTNISIYLAGMDFCGNLALNLLIGITKVCEILSNIPIPFMSILIAIFSIAVAIPTMLVQFLVCVPANLVMLFFSRRNEYKADRYACDVGLGKGLYEGLACICYGETKPGFLDQMWSTHPVTEKRLDKIEKMIAKRG